MVLLKKNIFTVVEFSSSKVSCVIFHIFASSIKVLGFATEASQGIKSGVVSNIELAVKTISRVVSRAEQIYGKTIDEVFVILSGCDIETQITTYEASLSNREITEKDLKNLISRATAELEVDNFRVIIHSICNGYSVDEVFVSNPVGMYANKISVLMSFISVDKLKLTNITRVFSNCRLIVFLA
jgi:cell division protein FtsA